MAHVVIQIEGASLRQLLSEIQHGNEPYSLRVAIDEGDIKFKVDEHIWSQALTHARIERGAEMFGLEPVT
jgi:hypothetical protein